MDIKDQLADYLQLIVYSSFDGPRSACGLSNVQALKSFDAKKVPYISIKEYIERFTLYLKTEPSTYIGALVLIDRALQHNPGSRLTSLNVHRLLVAAITVCEKVFNDYYWRNTDYAAAGAITNEELNKLELEFIAAIKFDLVVTEETYSEYLGRLRNHRQYVAVKAVRSEERNKSEKNAGARKELLLAYN